MTSAPIAIALRLRGEDHALEPGRDYLLGSGDDCDLRLPLAGPQHARVRVGPGGVELTDLDSGHGTWIAGERRRTAVLAPGDAARLGREDIRFVADDGRARIVPEPALRQAARQRRVAAARERVRERDTDPDFQQLMAEELRRAPWLGLSAFLHVLLLLLLWLTLPLMEPGGRASASVDISWQEGTGPAGEPQPPLPELATEAAEPFEPPREPVDPADDPAAPAEEPTLRETPLLTGNPRLAPRRGDAGVRGDGAVALGSGGFRKAVEELRRSGLEIVFVFDSTGSMTRAIADTKATITEMLDVLRALVPDARIGLVTYRDRGHREDYTVRSVPLGMDPWQAANFVQMVTAEGGGDRPEAVRDGIEAAFGQPWQPRAKRVVVLAGDAPPHAADFDPLLQRIKAFAKDGRSFVHALVTSPEVAGADTHDAFQAIAAAGRGQCVAMQDRGRILELVLQLAVGREFDDDLRRVATAVAAEADRVDTASLDLARRGGRDLKRALEARPIAAELLHALARRPRRDVYGELLVLLDAKDTPASTRQAIAWVLQRGLDLGQPPIDPAEPQPPAAATMTRLRYLVGRLPE